MRAGGDQSQQSTRPAGAAEAQDSRAAQREVFEEPGPSPPHTLP